MLCNLMNHRKTINDNRHYLVGELEFDLIKGKIRTDDFGKSDEDKITSKDTDEERIDILLDLLSEKPKETYDTFIEIVKENQPHVVEKITNTRRQRRNSESSIGNIMIDGGVPKLPSTYVPRSNIEKKLRDAILDAEDAPFLLCGGFGVGKKNILISALKNEEVMASYKKICWFTVGEDTDIKKKLMTLLFKLNKKEYSEFKNEVTEIIIEKIKEHLINNSVLLVLVDIKKEEDMKKFNFNKFCIIISTNNGLIDSLKLPKNKMQVPDEITYEECLVYLRHFKEKLDESKYDLLINKSDKNLYKLELLVYKVIDNRMWYNRLDELGKWNEMIGDYLTDIKCTSGKHDKSFDLDWLSLLDKGEWISVPFMIKMLEKKSDNNHNFECTEKLKKQNILVECVDAQLNQNVYSLNSIFHKTLSNNFTDKFKRLEAVKKIKEISEETETGDWFNTNKTEFYITFFRCLPSLIKVLKNDNKEYVQELKEFYKSFRFLACKIMFCSHYDLLSDYRGFDPKMKSYEIFFKQNTFLGVGNVEYLFLYLLQLALCGDSQNEVYMNALKTIKESKLDFQFYKWTNYKKSFKNWEITHTHKIDLDCGKNDKVIVASKESGCVSILSQHGCIKQIKATLNEIVSCHFAKDNKQFYIVDSEGYIKKFDGSNSLSRKMRRMRVHTEEESISKDVKIPEFSNDHWVYYCDDTFLVFDRYQKMFYFYDTEGNQKMSNFYYGIEDVVKIVLVSDDTVLFIYVLHSKTQISICTEYERGVNSYKPFNPQISESPVNDFIVCRNSYDKSKAGPEIFTLYVAVGDAIYKDSKKIFSLNSHEQINSVIINSKMTQLAILINNTRIEFLKIWDTDILTSQGFIKGTSSGFDRIQFISNPIQNDEEEDEDEDEDEDKDEENSHFNVYDDLLSITNGTIKSWTVLNLDKTPCSPEPNQCLSTYENKIFIPPSQSYIILQRIDKSLKKLNLPLVDTTPQISNSVNELSVSKALCYTAAGGYVFIGFINNKILVFTEIDFKTKKTLNVSVTIHELSAIDLEDHCILLGYWDADKNVNFLKLTSDVSTEVVLDTFRQCSFVKFFIINNQLLLCFISNNLLKVVSYDAKCNFSTILEIEVNVNTLLDCDISDNMDYLILIRPDNHIDIYVLNNDAMKVDHDLFTNYEWSLCKFRAKSRDEIRNLVAIFRKSNEASNSRVYLMCIDQNHKVSHVSKILLESFNENSLDLIGKVNKLVWSSCGNYIWLVSDALVRLSIKNTKNKSKRLKRQYTQNTDIFSIINRKPVVLKTLFGNCTDLYLVGKHDWPYTIDLQGYLYIFEPI